MFSLIKSLDFQGISHQEEISPARAKLPSAAENRAPAALTAPIIILNFLQYFSSPMEFVQVFDMLKVTPMKLTRIEATSLNQRAALSV
jgi:hypothetical protein